jgi:hypothetical protein
MPTDRQISQLVLQVDANIAVAQRELQNLARVVNQTSGQMNNSLASTAQAHTRLNGAFNQSRLAQMELSHVMTASVDAYAAGASPLRILTLEMGRVAQAASFMGGGNGIMGKLGAFMSGPWGIAVLLGTAVLGSSSASLLLAESVADLVQKMREHAQEAQNSKLADDEWARSIDGLIERNEKLTDDLKKRLKAEEDLDRQTAAQAQNDRSKADQNLHDEKTRLANLQRELAVATAGAANAGLGTNVGGPQEAQLEAQKGRIEQLKQEVLKAQQAVKSAQAAVTQSAIALGEEQGRALADSSAAVDLWAKNYLSALHSVESANDGALAGSARQISAAFDAIKKALSDAAGQGVGFKDTASQADGLARNLAQGKLTVEQYATAMKKLATSLEDVVEAAKAAKKQNPIELFKNSVIGAEGTGPNKLGSSASGFGQFTAQTWLGYFNRLFPGQAQLSDAAKLGFRDVRSVADAVIDKATTDYVAVLKSAGQGLSAANLYTVHLLGAGDAKKLFAAAPGDTTKAALGGGAHADAVLAGNPFLKGTVAQARAAIAGRIGDSSSAVSSGAVAIQAALEAQKKHELEQNDAFAHESAQIDAQILNVRRDLLGGYDTQADLASQEIESQRLAQQAAIEKQKDASQITDQQAQELSLQADSLAAARQAVIARHKYLDGLNQLADSARQESEFQVEDLRFADDMAKTQTEHRKIQLEILDVQYKQKEADLNRLLLTLQSNKDFATSVDLQRQALDVQAQLARLPIQRAQDQTRVQQGTLDPLQQYLDNIPHTADQVNQALQSIEVQGLDGLANALSHVGEGWKAMRDIALQTIQDILQALIKMQIEKMFFSLLSSAAGSIGAPDLGSAAAVNVGSSALSYGGPGIGALSAALPHLANGGILDIGGRGGTDNELLSINGVPRARVSASEKLAVIPKASRISDAANNNSPSVYHITVAAPNTGNPRRDRATALQQASLVREAVARVGRKGAA